MPSLRRLRGLLLRLVRRRLRSIAVGLLLVSPAVWVQSAVEQPAWWLQGLVLASSATGIALIWSGLVGVPPDWEEP
jgi:hypothetical protein